MTSENIQLPMSFFREQRPVVARLPLNAPESEKTEPSERLSAALEALIERFGRMVRRVGFDHGLAEADVDEVLQEVRIRIWRARPDTVDQLNATYVHRTAVSAALDIVRRRRSAGRLMDSEPPADQPISNAAADDAQRSLEVAELETQVAGAVASLAERRRPVVRMYLQGYSREEIAALLGWSEAKTRNLLYRGLADLRHRLALAGVGPEDYG